RVESTAHQRVAPREVELYHAEILRLAQDSEPGLGVELVAMLAVVEGIGAVDAAERAAIGQLGHQRVGPLGAAHATACTRPRSAMVWRKVITSRSTAGRSCPYWRASSSTMESTVCSPPHRWGTSAAVGLRTRPRSP